MKLAKKVLKNNLRVLTVAIKDSPSATVSVYALTGSRFEQKRINGISHFLEHMVFKGTSKRPTARQISEIVDSIGGEFNASTSKECTNFYIKARSAHLKTSFDVLSDMLLNSKFERSEIEKEKGVIQEEIKLYEDTPFRKAPELFETLIFGPSSLGRDIAGTSQSVAAVQREDFLSFVDSHYRGGKMLVVVGGGVEEPAVEQLSQEYFGSLQEEAKPFKPPSLKFVQNKPRVLVKNKKTEQAHLVLGFRGNPKGHPDRFVEAVLGTILGGGMSSRLFIEVRERRGLCYYVRTDGEHYWDNGYLATAAGLDVSRIDEAIKVILEEHYLISNKQKAIGNMQKLISDKELRKAKEYLKGHLALALEDSRAVVEFVAEQEIYKQKFLTPDEIFAEVDKVSREDVLRVASEFFVAERLNLAIIGPYEDENRFKRLLGL